MHAERFDLDEALAILSQTPASLHALLAAIPARWTEAADGHDRWSPVEVLVHLIQGERTNWLLRAQHILAGEQRPFTPFDRMGPRPDDQRMATLLATFATLRSANVAALQAMKLTAADLDRTGLHPEFGVVRLGQLLATWVVHDFNHLGQIVASLARAYGAAVGPWRAYLGILTDQA